MRTVALLCAAGALGLFALAGCESHHHHDHWDGVPAYRERIYYHDDYRGPYERWHRHDRERWRRYDRFDRDC